MPSPTIYGWGGLHPGSDESIEKGCTCARFDNNRGLYPPGPPTFDHPNGAWWITEGCPLHTAPTGRSES